MVQHRGARLQRPVLQHHAVRRGRKRWQRLDLEAAMQPEAARGQAAAAVTSVTSKTRSVGIAVGRVPGIGLQPVEQALDEALRPNDGQPLVPPDQQPQQPVEAGPVVHMGMRHRQHAQPQQVARHQGREIAAVQQDHAGQVQGFHKDAGIAGPAVQQARMQGCSHAGGSATPAAPKPRPVFADPSAAQRPRLPQGPDLRRGVAMLGQDRLGIRPGFRRWWRRRAGRAVDMQRAVHGPAPRRGRPDAPVARAGPPPPPPPWSPPHRR